MLDADSQLSLFERQLRSLHPRPAVLDLHEIDCTVVQSASSASRYLSRRSLALSVAAAWLVGIGFGMAAMALLQSRLGKPTSQFSDLNNHVRAQGDAPTQFVTPSMHEPRHSAAVATSPQSRTLDDTAGAPEWGTIVVEQWLVNASSGDANRLQRASLLKPFGTGSKEAFVQSVTLSRHHRAPLPATDSRTTTMRPCWMRPSAGNLGARWN